MRIRFGNYLPVLLIFAFGFRADTPQEKIISGFKKYLEELPQEKVYIHFDRPYYLAGETIWFKAYLVAGAQHNPSSFSRTLYVDLLTENKKLVKQLKIFVDAGSANGSFHLSDSLPSGNYLVQGYTRWMKNFNDEYFFRRPIKIWNNENLKKDNVVDKVTKVSVQFFPEGGEWVAGFKGKLAFKAIGEDGLARSVKGRVVDNKGQSVGEFQSNVLGMGSVIMVPLKGKSYRALIDDPKMEIALPALKESGVALSVTNTSASTDVVARIQSTELNKTVILIAQTRGIICYAVKINIPNTLSFVKMPKTGFPTGVAQITLLEESGMPLCERLTFVDQQEGLSIKIESNQKTFKPREKVTLAIEVKDSKGKPVMTDLSLAVCDDQYVLLDDRRESIYSYLYLSSELTGHIESPGYYFDPKNSDRIDAMDALLLTQGWRRFLFEKALSDQWPKPSLDFERGITVSGKLIDKFDGHPVPDGKVTYLSMFPVPEVKTTKTSADGSFKFEGLIYFDSARNLLQGENKRGGKLNKFALDSMPPALSASYPMYPLAGSLNNFEKDFIQQRAVQRKIDESYAFGDKGILLEKVVIAGKKIESINTIKKIYGNGSKTLQIAGNEGVENLQHPLQLIQGKVAGVVVAGQDIFWRVHIRGFSSVIGGTETPLILINNVPVDISTLNSLPIRDIESIDIFKGPDAAIFGAQGMYGAIAFYTRVGRNAMPPKEGVFPLYASGYQIPQQFYSPQYDVKKPEHARPDNRLTLFWAPLIVTDSTGHASVSFYNHDRETTVTGLIEGLSITGIPGKGQVQYTIKN